MTLNLTSDLVSRNCCISPIFFEIGIPNLVCKCILGYLSVTNHFWVTVTLTSDLVFKNYCVQSISPILFDVGIPNLGWWFLLGWRSGAYHFESFWPWHWLLASFLVFSCNITAIFPQMCLILDQFLWGHSSRVCDISCLFWPAYVVLAGFWREIWIFMPLPFLLGVHIASPSSIHPVLYKFPVCMKTSHTMAPAWSHF